jgi:hypothetical protein
MVDYVKFSEWLDLELPPLPGNQTIPSDQMIVIRAGLPYAYDPVTRLAYSEMSSNAAATGISTQNQWESIAGTLVAPAGIEGFTLAANVWTVTTEDSLKPLLISAGQTAMKVGSGDDTYQFGIFLNDVLVGAPMSINTHMTKLDSCYLTGPVILETGDTVEVKVRNLDTLRRLWIEVIPLGISGEDFIDSV